MDQSVDAGIKDKGTKETNPTAPPSPGLFNGRRSTRIRCVIKFRVVDVDIGKLILKHQVVVRVQRNRPIVARQLVDSGFVTRIYICASCSERWWRIRDDYTVIVGARTVIEPLPVIRRTRVLSKHKRLLPLLLYMRGSVRFDVQTRGLPLVKNRSPAINKLPLRIAVNAPRSCTRSGCSL